jgi:uncharacterized protein
MKTIDAYWSAIGTQGLEHLILRQGQGGIQADGLVLRFHEGQGLRIGYQVHCDSGWRTQQVMVKLSGPGEKEVRLLADGNGSWNGPNGEPLEALNGCIDVDIMATPFTNTLPIRRLGLGVGESIEIEAAYVRIPDLQISRSRQRYTCLEKQAGRGRYLYESLDGDFNAQLVVDAEGLVLDYEGIWERTL